MTAQRLRIEVEGVVQGVGFRPFVHALAHRLGVRGFVSNQAGDVVIEAEADASVLDHFLVALEQRAPSAARVDRVSTASAAPRGELEFRIESSTSDDGAAASIAPDLATCASCIDEVLDASSRRFDYAFTSCASCGPRLTIVTAAPYDRSRTTMAAFPLCDACRAEHDDPSDRRFHAQPIACPACGPHLAMDGERDPIAAAATAIRAGRIVAIKGLGGYHLACDATSEPVVAELRRRKHRDAKPFAVMVATADAAAELGVVDGASRNLLESAARPIVLVPRKVGACLAPAIAPDVADLGLVLPYTPIHHLLLRALDGLPIVMTSGNVTDEPIAFEDKDAIARLGAIADRFVVHDRPIHMRCEDSVTRVIRGAPMILRRARGYAPAPLRLPFAVDRPTLALGGHVKAAFVLGTDDVAYVSPHLGDLDHLSAYEGYLVALEHFEKLHRVRPERIVCDLHPDYATSQLAEVLARSRGIEHVAVQHHRAHFASALADAGIVGRAIGVIFDGAGLGSDGTIWGGEVLVGDYGDVRRAAHLATVAQPGGDRASTEPWRMAIAHLVAAGEPIDPIDHPAGPRVAELCARAPQTSSIGRLFDAVAAITGVCGAAEFEGQAAMRLEAIARDVRDEAAYPFELRGDAPIAIDVAPMIRAIAAERRRGTPRAVIACRFHSTVVELAAVACERIARVEQITDVVLSGGVFQNAILATELPARLIAAGLRPHTHRQVPPNDGGLALGQLAIAAGRRA